MLLRLALLLTVLFALLLGFFRLSDYHSLPALTACALPCWQGIQVNQTLAADAVAILTRVNTYAPNMVPCYDLAAQPCVAYQWLPPDHALPASTLQIRQGVVYSLLDQPPGLLLGDVLLAFDRLGFTLYATSPMPDSGQLDLALTFLSANLAVDVIIPCPTAYFALMHTPVAYIIFAQPESVLHPAAPFRTVRHTVYRLCER